jgi:protein-S-isoprenylcysteine O-methyltransferase Ste14
MGLILFLLLSGPVLPRRVISACLFGGGLLLVSLAALAVGPFGIRVGPAPERGARLTTSGPYRWIRHPMYMGTLLITSAWLAEGCSWARGLAWLALAGVLVVKLRLEERMLGAMFPEYAAYARRTRRLIPFVY